MCIYFKRNLEKAKSRRHKGAGYLICKTISRKIFNIFRTQANNILNSYVTLLSLKIISLLAIIFFLISLPIPSTLAYFEANPKHIINIISHANISECLCRRLCYQNIATIYTIMQNKTLPKSVRNSLIVSDILLVFVFPWMPWEYFLTHMLSLLTASLFKK